MSQFSGRQGHGAERLRKVEKREEAEARNKRYQSGKLEFIDREAATKELADESS